MAWRQSPLAIIGIMNAGIALACSLLISWRGRARGVRTFAIVLLCMAGWAATTSLGQVSLDPQTKLLWARMTYVFAVTVPVASLAFGLRYRHPKRSLTREQIALLAIEPVITLLLLWTSGAHGLVWRSVTFDATGPVLTLRVAHGPWFWIHSAYSYLLVLVSLVLIGRGLSRSTHLFRQQGVAMIFAGLSAAIGSILSFAFPALGQLPVAVGTSLTNAIVIWNVVRLGLFDVMPVARELVIEQMDACVFVLDREGRVVDLNAPAQALIGRTAAEVVGQPTEQVFAAYPRFVARLRDRTETREELAWEEGQRHFDLRISPLRDPAAQLAGRLVVLRDITAGKRAAEALQESEEKYRNVIERASDGIAIVQDGIIKYANPRLAEIAGYDVDEVIGTPFTEYIWPDDVAPVADRYARRMAGEEIPATYETTIKHKDGSGVAVEINAGLVMYEGKAADLGLVRDITERKRSEEALRRRAQEMAALQGTLLDITAAHDLPTLLQAIVERAAQLLNASSGGLYLTDSERQEVRCVVSYNTAEDYTGVVLKYGEGASGTVAQTGEPLIIDDYRSWEGRAAIFEDQGPFIAVLCAPMVWQGEVTGVINVVENLKRRHFTQADLDLMRLFASHAAIAVENHRLYSAAQRELMERRRVQEFNEGIVQGMSEGLLIEDADGLITFVNPALERLLGYATQELIGCHWQKIVPQAEIERVQAKTAQRPVGVSERYESRLLSKDGREIPVLIGARPRLENDTFTGVLSVFADITEHKRLEAEIEQRRLYLERVLASAPDAVITVDNQHMVQEWNQGAVRLFGYLAEEAQGQDLDDLVAGSDPQTLEQAVSLTRELLSGRPVPPREVVRYRKDGTPVHVIVAGSPILSGDELIGVVGVYTDITERKQAEAQLQASLREKEVLLKEVHHRVRNNLQVISSLLYLQSLTAQDPGSAQMLHDSRNRVQSMAMVHEILYGSQDLGRIPFGEYVHSLTASLMQSYGTDQSAIETRIHVDEVMLSVDLAIPCGLIINELVSNALKHAFAGRDSGMIEVHFGSAGDGLYTLEVRDNGVGLPHGLGVENAETLGWKLVKMLVEQLDGTMQVDGDVGTQLRITFPAPGDER
jgi:PAS domain S-box-containing protein